MPRWVFVVQAVIRRALGIPVRGWNQEQNIQSLAGRVLKEHPLACGSSGLKP